LWKSDKTVRKKQLSMMPLGAALKSICLNNGPAHSSMSAQISAGLCPLTYFRWVIDDKLSLDILSPAGWSLKPKANILLPNAVHRCISRCTTDKILLSASVTVDDGLAMKNLPRVGR